MASARGRFLTSMPLFAFAVAVIATSQAGCKVEPPTPTEGCGASCQDDDRCVKGRCLPESCPGVSCGALEVCLGGACVDERCVDLDCAAGSVCAAGQCVPLTCGTPECHDGEGCVGGACVELACVGTTCSAQERCVAGACYPAACEGTPCPDESVCVAGECVTPACLGVLCEAGLSCFDGACSQCAQGMRPLSDGSCVPFIELAGACQQDLECASGFCVDGVCCDGACDGACSTCSTPTAPGRCVSSPSGSLDDACGGYRCAADGTCLTSCEDRSDCAPDARCSDGTCLPGEPLGSACSLASECLSGLCVEGVCCDGACEGPCESCAVAGQEGTCSPVADGSVPAVGCAGRLCNGASGDCDSPCLADADCAVGHYCDVGECVPALEPGIECSRAAQCASSHCVEGVCCDSACGDACLSCSLEGSVGACSSVAVFSEDPLCTPHLCGRGACLQGCERDEHCVDGNACIDSLCVGKRGNGQACEGGNECVSGHCADGICCDTACDQGAQGCFLAAECSTGTCTIPPAAGGTSCDDDGNVCTRNECDGAGNCIHPPTTGTLSCSDGASCTSSDTCNNGVCEGATACYSPPGQCWVSVGGCAADGTCRYMPKLQGATCASDGNPCTIDSCDGSGRCVHVPGNAGVICRTSANACDVAEVCSGFSAQCPSDGFADVGTTCGNPAIGACDAQDTCNGAGACVDRIAAPAAVCRDATSSCDVAERCNGVSKACPDDGFAPVHKPCGSSSNDGCDAPDSCDGAGACVDRVDPKYSVCRRAANWCDVSELCDGVSSGCPSNTYMPAGSPCGGTPSYICDAQDTCNGNGTCVARYQPSSTVCRPDRGVCDYAEYCSGSSIYCPTNRYRPNGTSCGTCRVCSYGSCDYKAC